MKSPIKLAGLGVLQLCVSINGDYGEADDRFVGICRVTSQSYRDDVVLANNPDDV